MPKYIIERKVPNVGQSSKEEMHAMAKKSNEVLNQLNGEVNWLESFVTDDKIYCVYVAPNEELVKRHAQLAGFPADSVAKVNAILDPSSGEIETSRRTDQAAERTKPLQ
ncbi:DUF4242 domain-containing protein [Bdellovibrio sp. HCB337]|uniref:DUF4242 domain-containing protein n=1 Tax=Bdellovibrio sp. HCB337 TaxID=3394358 RepID=UPI0039A65CD3